jgi:hypothetical protein
MRKPKIKLPGQSWSIKEKLDWLVAMLTDHRLTYATRVIGATMALYFHNTQSGALHPSREQISEKTGAGRKKSMLATQSLRRFRYLTYDDSDGGCNHRNTYQLLKQSPKVEPLNRVGKDSVNRVEKDSLTGSKKTHAGESKRLTQLPFEDTTYNETPESSPLPCDGKASASVEKKEEASRAHPEGPPITEEEKARRLALAAETIRKLRGGFAR